MRIETTTGQLSHWATNAPDQNFLWCDGDWRTYSEVDTDAAGLAAGLQRLGIQRGERVAAILPTQHAAITLIFACAKLGAINVFLNTFLRGEFLRHQLADCQASVIVTDELGLDQLRSISTLLPDLQRIIVLGDADASGLHVATIPFTDIDTSLEGASLPDIKADDIYSIVYTSGTTGLPKGCLMSHRYATHIPYALAKSGRFRAGDSMLTASPLFHTSGQIIALGSTMEVGGSIAFEREYHASTYIELANKLGATSIFGVAAIAVLLLAQPPKETDREHSIERAIFNALPESTQLALEDRFGFHVIGEMYGQTECVPVAASPVDGPRKRGSAGRVLEYFEVALFDDDDRPVEEGAVGEIAVRPKIPGVIFDGYWGNPQATLELRRTLWQHTGDYGRFDSDGFLHFVERKKEAIRKRGEFIVSRELEAAIRKHPSIEAVAVHAVSSVHGEDDIRCWIVLSSGSTLTPQEAFTFFRDELPYFAIPRYVDITDELPTNGSGRVMKHALKERQFTSDTWDFESQGLVVQRDERRSRRPNPTTLK